MRRVILAESAPLGQPQVSRVLLFRAFAADHPSGKSAMDVIAAQAASAGRMVRWVWGCAS